MQDDDPFEAALSSLDDANAEATVSDGDAAAATNAASAMDAASPEGSQNSFESQAPTKRFGQLAPKFGQDPIENLNRFLEAVTVDLADMEALKLAYVHEELNDSYYHLWTHDANKMFAQAVRLRRRLKSYEAEEADNPGLPFE